MSVQPGLCRTRSETSKTWSYFEAAHLSLLTTKPLKVTSQVRFKLHYDNTPMHYTAIFHGCKNDNFQMKILIFFLIFALNINCGYTLEVPQGVTRVVITTTLLKPQQII